MFPFCSSNAQGQAPRQTFLMCSVRILWVCELVNRRRCIALHHNCNTFHHIAAQKANELIRRKSPIVMRYRYMCSRDSDEQWPMQFDTSVHPLVQNAISFIYVLSSVYIWGPFHTLHSCTHTHIPNCIPFSGIYRLPSNIELGKNTRNGKNGNKTQYPSLKLTICAFVMLQFQASLHRFRLYVASVGVHGT